MTRAKKALLIISIALFAIIVLVAGILMDHPFVSSTFIDEVKKVPPSMIPPTYNSPSDVMLLYSNGYLVWLNLDGKEVKPRTPARSLGMDFREFSIDPDATMHLSPDHKRLLASNTGGDVLYVTDLDSGKLYEVAKAEEDCKFTSTAWSPDGKLVACLLARRSGSQLPWVFNFRSNSSEPPDMRIPLVNPKTGIVTEVNLSLGITDFVPLRILAWENRGILMEGARKQGKKWPRGWFLVEPTTGRVTTVFLDPESGTYPPTRYGMYSEMGLAADTPSPNKHYIARLRASHISIKDMETGREEIIEFPSFDMVEVGGVPRFFLWSPDSRHLAVVYAKNWEAARNTKDIQILYDYSLDSKTLTRIGQIEEKTQEKRLYRLLAWAPSKQTLIYLNIVGEESAPNQAILYKIDTHTGQTTLLGGAHHNTEFIGWFPIK
jgi:hypothetical protein